MEITFILKECILLLWKGMCSIHRALEFQTRTIKLFKQMFLLGKKKEKWREKASNPITPHLTMLSLEKVWTLLTLLGPSF